MTQTSPELEKDSQDASLAAQLASEGAKDKDVSTSDGHAESETPVETSDATTHPAPAWTKTYDSVKSKLPGSISSHIPSSSTAASTVDHLSSRLQTLSAKGASELSELQRNGSKRMDTIRESSGVRGVQKRIGPDQFLTHAYSVTNSTQIAVNVSLNQVGPLMYSVLAPNDTFERRVPNLWFTLELRPYTSPSTAYTPWSVSWPIMALVGPVAAATSLLLIPFAALAVGGTALASLAGFGTTVAEGAAATVAGAGSAAATVGGYAAKAAHLPGGAKIKGKLVEAAKTNLGKGKEVVTEGVVRYLGKATAGAALGGAALGAKEDEDRGRAKELERGKKKLEEVDVTGLPLEKVLKCETGKKRIDRALTEAFKKLNIKVKEFKAKDNPVLRIVGGPEIEERGKHQYLVFYPLYLERIPDVIVEPIPTTELPPTETESALMRDTLVVDSVEDAEEVAKRAPVHDEAKRREVEEAVQEVEGKKVAGHGEKAAAAGGEGWFGWGK